MLRYLQVCMWHLAKLAECDEAAHDWLVADGAANVVSPPENGCNARAHPTSHAPSWRLI